MRILLSAINYAPEKSGNAPYTTGLAEHLATQGHEVHVVTGMPHYPEWRALPLAEEGSIVNGVHLHRRRHFIPERPSTIKRALYEASFLGSASALGGASLLRGLPRPDVTIGVVPTLSNGVVARLASMRFGTPYGLLFQDLMGKAATQSGIAGGSSVGGMIERAEGWIARKATRVAMVAEGFRPYLESIGVDSASLHRVRNWTHMQAPDKDALDLRERFGWADDEIICLHAGNMGNKQGLDNVIEAARLAQHTEPAIRFVLMGDGNQAASLKQKAQEYGLQNLQFLPPQEDSIYVNALAAAEILLLSLSPTVTDMAFPSKVGSYVSAGRPILASVSAESEIGKELIENSAALMIEPGQPENLLEGIVRLATDDLLSRRLTRAAQQYGRSFARESALEELERFVFRVAGQELPSVTEKELTEVA